MVGAAERPGADLQQAIRARISARHWTGRSARLDGGASSEGRRMTATAETIPEAVGDWTLRGVRARGYDLMFAPDELSDSALSAASRAQCAFRSPFPAWPVYRTI